VNWLLAGVLTIYLAAPGAALYCDCNDDLIVGKVSVAWIALPVELYDDGGWECGDLLYVHGEWGGFLARALDAGPLSQYYVEQWGAHTPIVGDIPAHLAPFEGLSALGSIINLSLLERTYEPESVQTVRRPNPQRREVLGLRVPIGP